MKTHPSASLRTFVALALALVFNPVLLSQAAQTNAPVVITAGPDWIPLKPELEIEPGSALDFSILGFADGPAGKRGRVIARRDGQFAFADSPEQARRFYGVNLCFGAHYLTRSEADRLADRLVRLGYNALRIHHYERDLTQGQANSTTLNPQKLEQFDYLLAALIRRGIYLTTDLYVSRSVPWREIGIHRDGAIAMDTFKILVPVHAGAFDDWKRFARALLDHVNPHTQRRYADEPALAWLALINEGNFGNFFKDIQTMPEWKMAWNKWLTARYVSRRGLAAAWGADLKENEEPATQTVGFPDRLQADGLRTRDCILFLADTERDMVQRMKNFLRNELGCHALVSNASSWTRFTTDQSARAVYDYVDEHFYVDHPQFLEGSWRLPSRSANTSPVAEGAPGGRSIAFTRLFEKPFALTEYNYSGPGRFRGVGGILTGAIGALQGWGGIWRFAYSHSREAMFNPSPMGYFDMATDPLSQAAERASICLFLRGDLHMAPHSVAVVMTPADLAQPKSKIPTLAPPWHWLAWVTRIGTQWVPDPKTPLPLSGLIPLGWQTPASDYTHPTVLALDPYAVGNDTLLASLKKNRLVPENLDLDPARKYFRSETSQLTLDGPRDCLVLDTARTAGGYAPARQTIAMPGAGVTLSMQGTDATVWVSALDLQPIRKSRRLLVTHLTDLQNTEIKYAETTRKTLLDWGRLPHLVRAGQAEVELQLDPRSRYRIWALASSGRRLAEIKPRQINPLTWTLDVAGDAAQGARMLYEVAAE